MGTCHTPPYTRRRHGSCDVYLQRLGLEKLSWYGFSAVSLFLKIDLVRYLNAGYFPKVADTRHGYVPDLRSLPQYRDMDDRTFAAHTTHRVTRLPMKEGFLDSQYNPAKGGGVLGRGVPGVVWHRSGQRSLMLHSTAHILLSNNSPSISHSPAIIVIILTIYHL